MAVDDRVEAGNRVAAGTDLAGRLAARIDAYLAAIDYPVRLSVTVTDRAA